jgi:bifunctional non-homologous end joining protein LigD
MGRGRHAANVLEPRSAGDRIASGSAASRRGSRASAKSKAIPECEVELATLVRSVPEGDDWVFEIKFDGYRALAYLDHGEVQLVSRNGLSFNDRFAPIRERLARLPCKSAVIDGEVCSIDASGRTRFEALQGVERDRTQSELVLFAFDLLWLDGKDLRGESLLARKERLAKLIPGTASGVVRRSEHVVGDGPSFLEAARELGLEGIMAKRGSSPYRGGRSLDWQKIKVDRREELLIAGYTPPKGSRARFGALLLAIPDEKSGALRYAGKVGTGFDTRTLEDLFDAMAPLRVEHPPVVDPPRERGAVWVEPRLVAEIRYTEWTSDGKLRHPTFLGLREDKPPREVRRERPVSRTKAR